ncbi:glutaminase [Chitinasiproducens palmae]|uniref:Glutaminase n=1 Tax=Chitinasiproducens palmae TaxID=1770053 RepID=A0A1H2PL32_9BURK|nr:glutaminase [Chitinasiproducens palmae]SDV47188.1 L-glutaminase [Chitinasiproducens palmae]
MDSTTSFQTSWRQRVDDAGAAAEACRGVGEVANYIPALRDVAPDRFGIAVANLDGQIVSYGDANDRFSVQSLSKVFVLVQGYRTWGDEIWRRVGQFPSSNPFNSIVELELEHGIPRNPFLNSGALAIADSLVSRHVSMESSIVTLLRELSGSAEVDYNQTVAESEFRCADRNIAAAYLMKGHGNFANPVADVVRSYCAVCAIEASCTELARASLFLANRGICPGTGKRIVPRRTAQQVCALMLTTGTYEHSGRTAFAIGLPTKSGVGGGIIAVIPNQGTICAWSPRLDSTGNSVRAMAALENLSAAACLSIFG